MKQFCSGHFTSSATVENIKLINKVIPIFTRNHESDKPKKWDHPSTSVASCPPTNGGRAYTSR